MKILSEKTNKEYASVDECLAAEKEFDEAEIIIKDEYVLLKNSFKIMEVEDLLSSLRMSMEEIIKDFKSENFTLTEIVIFGIVYPLALTAACIFTEPLVKCIVNSTL